MDILAKILLTLCVVDLVVFPFYMVWIIRKGIWLYDMQQFHRVFHLVQLLFFVSILLGPKSPNHMVLIGLTPLLAVYFATCLQHNFKLHQLLTPNAYFGSAFPYKGPFVTRYFDMLKVETGILGWICKDVVEKGAIVDPDECDVVCKYAGMQWGFVNYLKNYGERLACDALAVVLVLALLV